ncbi:MAG: type IV secretory system conjugative DNA transfer family protein [Oscillatoria princeps RMCB-10]|jgi:type IV secretion system protein VirD4|nr:type IV secretory system conjugative DNA transfer family protein [Oscillatoria princeps RMCB-10]
MTWQDSFENLGWGLRNLFGGGETILGPNEPLPPTDIHLRDLRDYSGTATLNEITDVLKSPGSPLHNCRILKHPDRYASQPVLDLGKFLKIAGGKVKPTQEVWMQEKSIYKNVAIIGPPGSGKTEGLIVPGIKAAIDAGLSNIVIDVKGGSLIDKLGEYAQQKGVRVIYWSTHPQEVYRSHSINLLDNIYSIQDAQILASCLYGSTDNLGESRHFAMRDIAWMAQWIMLIKQVFGEAATLKHIYQIAQNPVETLTQFLRLCPDTRLQAAIQSQLRLIQNSDSGDSAFTWAIQDAISFFGWPNFEQVTGHSDILLRDIQRRPTLLVIGAELAGRDVSKKISAALIDILMTIFYERWTQNEGEQGIVFWIDEFPRIQQQIDVAEFTSVARSAKGSIVIAAQSLEQITPEYREQVMENFDTVVLCRGVGAGAAEWLSSRLGNRNQNVRRRRHHEPNPQDEFPWLRTHFDRERYENWRESAPVLDTREIQYPVGNQYVAIVHSRTACRKPFLVDYERVLAPSTTWQPPRRLNWRESASQATAIPGASSPILIWREDNSNQRQNEQQDRLNWRDPDSNQGQNLQQSNRQRLNWRDGE